MMFQSIPSGDKSLHNPEWSSRPNRRFEAPLKPDPLISIWLCRVGVGGGGTQSSPFYLHGG